MDPRLRSSNGFAIIKARTRRATGEGRNFQQETTMRMTTMFGVAATLSFAATVASAYAGEAASPALNAAAKVCFGQTNAAGWPEVIEKCTQVLSVNVTPDAKAGAYYNRGAAYLRTGSNAKAIADFNEAIRLLPRFGRALQARASAFIGEKNFDGAIADLTAAIAIEPTSSVAYNNRGMAYLGKGNAKSALADFNKSIELDPKDPASYAARGSAYLTLGDKTKALADLDKSLALNPDQAIALFNRGVLLIGLGQKDRAVADFQAVLKLSPDNKAAKDQLALLAKSGG